MWYFVFIFSTKFHINSVDNDPWNIHNNFAVLFTKIFYQLTIRKGNGARFLINIFNFRSTEQKSDKIRLEVGRKYFIEAVLIEGGGGDHLSVAMDLPDGTRVGPITHEYLSKHPN